MIKFKYLKLVSRMGGSLSINKINFEDMQTVIETDCTIISTMSIERQDCLISGTLKASDEERVFNKEGISKDIRIVVYGENSCDDLIKDKCHQLTKLGFTDINVYVGGLFEWLLLQDIYGNKMFPTTSLEKDLLKFKGVRKIYPAIQD